MTNQEILTFNEEVQIFAEYLVRTKSRNTTLNYAIDANFRRLKPVVEAIYKQVNEDLKELEKKAYDAVKVENDTRSYNELVSAGLETLTEEEQKKHKELMVEYNKWMAEENTEFEVYKVKFEKVESAEIELPYMGILNKMLYEDN